MDDRGKLEIRHEFTVRFWRLMVVVPVLVGLLLWWWLSADKHGGFLFLTVLPLVFLVPLARYYYALRSLTEPESADSTTGIETTQTAGGIDEALKARIRRTARTIHWIVQAFLILLICLGIYTRIGFRWVADSFSGMQLTIPSSIVMSQFSPLFFSRGRELIPFAPPDRAEDRLAWAESIERELGQPVAVFIKRGPSLTWVMRKDSLAEGVAQVPHLFDADLSRTKRGVIDTIGSYEVRRISEMEPKGSGFKTWIVGPLDQDLRWGVVLNFDDIWPAFFRSLKAADTTSPLMGSPAWTIQEVVDIEGSGQNYKAGMRVLRNGEVLYATPNLDTTRHLYKIDSPPLRWEYYQAEMDKNYATFIGKGPVSWRSFIAWAVLLAAFFQFYRWIRKLTTPSA